MRVACATQDIGTGTYTILAQLAAEQTGAPLDRVEVALGDTALPAGPISGGSMATASVVPAVFQAADGAIASLLQLATTTPGSPFAQRRPEDLTLVGGRVRVKADGAGEGVPFADVLRLAGCASSAAAAGRRARSATPRRSSPRTRSAATSSRSRGSRRSARLRVSRVVTVIDAGRILNPLAGRNQIEGAVVMGIGMAMLEHTQLRPADGRADQQQPGRLRGGGERRRAEDRGPLPGDIPTRS